MKRIFCFGLAFLLVMSCSVSAEELWMSNKEIEQSEDIVTMLKEPDVKLYCDATLEDDFPEKVILISLTTEVSVANHLYTAQEFSEMFDVEIEKVEPLFYVERDSTALINWDKYRQMFTLTIAKSGKQAVLDAIKIIEQHPYVRGAEPNLITTIEIPQPTSNDRILYMEENLQDPSALMMGATSNSGVTNDLYINQQYAIGLMDLNSAWEYSVGDNVVRVGIIDAGIDGNHPDLVDNLDFDLGKSFLSTDADPWLDPTGHGTHIAGIIGAKANNSIGVSGVNWNVKMVSLQAAGPKVEEGKTVYKCGVTEFVNAVEYAGNNNIPILNYSYGGENFSQRRLEAIELYNGLFVCSAGNGEKDSRVGFDVDLTKAYYPSRYDCANIISVANTDSNDELYSSSNFGATSVDLAAPGTEILSTFPTSICIEEGHGFSATHKANGYHYMWGTSMAAPQVTGVAALLLSYYPDLTTAELKEYILGGVDPVAGLTGKCVTGGRLNAANSLALAHADKYVGTIDGRYVTGDFDGDGKDDTAYMADFGNTRGGEIRVSLSDGNSADFWDTWFQSSAFKPSMIGSRLVAGDFNGDGKDDIAAFCDHSTVVDANRGTMYVFLSTGTSFGTWPQIWYQSDYFLATSVDGRMVAGDFNGDGKDDISCMIDYSFYMPEGNSRIVTFISSGSAFTNQTWFDTTAFPAQYVTDRFTAGDFNGDGKDDIACLFDYSFQQTGKSTMFVFVSNGSNFGSWPQSWFVTESACPADKMTGRFTAGDFDGDGRDDVAAMFDYSYYQPQGTSTVFVFRSYGSNFGNWPQSWFVTQAFPAGPVTDRFEAGDLTGDGKADIAAMYSYIPESELLGTLFVFTSTGSNFGNWPQTWISTPANAAASSQTVTAIANAQATYVGGSATDVLTGTYELDEEESYRLHCERMGLL